MIQYSNNDEIREAFQDLSLRQEVEVYLEDGINIKGEVSRIEGDLKGYGYDIEFSIGDPLSENYRVIRSAFKGEEESYAYKIPEDEEKNNLEEVGKVNKIKV